MRVLLLLVVLSVAVGCAKRGAKTAPAKDDTAKPAASDTKGKADEPNFLNDPRFKKEPPLDGQSPHKQPWGFTAPEGGWQGPAAGAPAKRVEAADMKEVWVFIENASLASGKMPATATTYQALIAAESKAAPLVKDGSITLVAATLRESVWAYETQALTSGGLVATQNGVETLTAAELKARLGK